MLNLKSLEILNLSAVWAKSYYDIILNLAAAGEGREGEGGSGQLRNN